MECSTLVNVVRDFEHVHLGDRRLDANALAFSLELQKNPAPGIPGMFDSNDSKLEAVYRFMRNDAVGLEELIAPHFSQTAKRAACLDTVLIVHDTTNYTFGGGAREDMGVIDPSSEPGFYCHHSLCLGFDGEPLGLLALQTWNRTAGVIGKRSQNESQYDPQRESLRWNYGVEMSDDAIRKLSDFGRSGPCPLIIHLMDREGDCMELLWELMVDERQFVVRAKTDRRLEKGRNKKCKKLFGTVASTKVLCTYTTQVVRRLKKTVESPNTTCNGRKAIRSRKSVVQWSQRREAELEVRATRVTIVPGNGHHVHVPDEGFEINVVHVREKNPPADVEPVEWYLLTQLQIDAEEDALFVVDCYCRRWMIEEFHKAEKTGCNYESCRCTSFANCMRMLMLIIPISVQMLRLRWADREYADAPASKVLTSEQIEVLKAHGKKQRKPLSPEPTIREALRAIARLGGHRKHNGAPGWQTLYRGFTKLAILVDGYQLAMSEVYQT
jgi:hypothetical protein